MPPKNARSDDASSGSNIPAPPPPTNRNRRLDNERKRRSRHRAYSVPREKRRPDITIVLCIYNGNGRGWRTAPLTFNRNRTTDEELWTDICAVYRNDLFREWRRLLGFKRLKHILPIEFSRNDVPIRQEPKDVPGAHEFMHCFHHPTDVRTDHEWVDWFVQFASDPDKSYGLEFVEGLWAEKLAVIAILIDIAMIAVSIVWVIRGGQLQTVFTVMGFVLSGAAANVALVALYYQVVLPG